MLHWLEIPRPGKTKKLTNANFHLRFISKIVYNRFPFIFKKRIVNYETNPHFSLWNVLFQWWLEIIYSQIDHPVYKYVHFLLSLFFRVFLVTLLMVLISRRIVIGSDTSRKTVVGGETNVRTKKNKFKCFLFSILISFSYLFFIFESTSTILDDKFIFSLGR